MVESDALSGVTSEAATCGHSDCLWPSLPQSQHEVCLDSEEPFRSARGPVESSLPVWPGPSLYANARICTGGCVPGRAHDGYSDYRFRPPHRPWELTLSATQGVSVAGDHLDPDINRSDTTRYLCLELVLIVRTRPATSASSL